MRPFPETLSTARLSLRQPDELAAREEHGMINESLDHLWPWFGFRDRPPTLAEREALAVRQRAEAAAGTAVSYIVRAGEHPIGKVWLDVEGPNATMGWWMRASETGRGYATEAVRALCAMAFDVGVERIEAHTDPDNARSRALAERAGFSLEVIRPDAHDRPDGVRRPNCIYVLHRPNGSTA